MKIVLCVNKDAKERVSRRTTSAFRQGPKETKRMCLKSRTTTMMMGEKIIAALYRVMGKEASLVVGDNMKEMTSEDYERLMDIRTACIHYIRCPHVFFKTHPDTFAVAVHILDAVLWKLKVTQRFMSIIAVACYVIAAKLMEENEEVPSHRQLAQLPGHEWTPNDLCRMELYILDKLSWSLPDVTYISYLPLFAQIFSLNQNIVMSSDMIVLGERCLKSESTVLLPARVLALALVLHTAGQSNDSLLQEKRSQVLKFCKIDDTKLKVCLEKLNYLTSQSYSPLITSRKKTSVSFPMKIFTRPSEMGSPDLATIEE